MPRRYWVYIMASLSHRIYIGVTGYLHLRVQQHRKGNAGAFTAKYRINRLVHVEETNDVWAAINREKQVKGWARAKKIALIESCNPEWDELLPPGE
jgi:putative endonuclease